MTPANRLGLIWFPVGYIKDGCHQVMSGLGWLVGLLDHWSLYFDQAAQSGQLISESLKQIDKQTEIDKEAETESETGGQTDTESCLIDRHINI